MLFGVCFGIIMLFMYYSIDIEIDFVGWFEVLMILVGEFMYVVYVEVVWFYLMDFMCGVEVFC